MSSPAAVPLVGPKAVTLSRPPSICIKPSLSSASPPPTSTSTPTSLMSKEWVVPPRPKPGRKPATDTPPTKRKAQNRAAQRAFRERRAARVGELEEQMKQIEDEHDQERETLQAKVERLEKNVNQYQSELAKWIERYRGLEKELNQARHQSETIALPRRKSGGQIQRQTTDEEVQMGCGNCSPQTRCQCLDDALDAMTGNTGHSESTEPDKRSHSPSSANRSKRVKLEPQDSLEIDFTAIYASKSAPNSSSRPEVVSPPSAIADPCGFCQDGTPCICADMAAEAEQHQVATTLQSAALPNPVARIHQISQYTPPPSEGDVTSAQSLPTTANPCAIGPGTCAQCRLDPNSTIFCKSLAASRSQTLATSAPSGGCCGGKGPGGSCCQSSSQSVPLPPSRRSTRTKSAALPTTSTSSLALSQTVQNPSQTPSITLTCADAYTTLSRHPAYERASGEIATWLPKLHAADAAKNTPAGPAVQGRPAMEIDAANVMAVLKDFDRRFGTD